MMKYEITAISSEATKYATICIETARCLILESGIVQSYDASLSFEPLYRFNCQNIGLTNALTAAHPRLITGTDTEYSPVRRAKQRQTTSITGRDGSK